MLLVLEANCKMERLLRLNKGYKLPPDVAADLLKQSFVYVQNQAVVHNWNGDRVFNLAFKHHQLLHCAVRSKEINPRHTWCFMGEDYMRIVKRCGLPCTKGTPHFDVHRKLLSRLLRVKDCIIRLT